MGIRFLFFVVFSVVQVGFVSFSHVHSTVLFIHCVMNYDRMFPLPIPGGRAVSGVELRPLDCWDRGHGCSSLVFAVCCVGSGLCDELITRSEESYRVCVCNYV
jgi:hypothetical protein